MEILVADDSRTSNMLICQSLTRLGHHVIQAFNAKEAIYLFNKQRPDLIILDVVMGEMNGFECAKEIRKIDPLDWIPIIFLSASVDDESIAKGIDAGGDDYLTKPFSEITLAAKIKAMQRIADMRQQLFETTQKLYLQSSTDALTGTYNRFQFDRIIKEVTAAADRFKHTCSLFFIDLDNFKNINDTFGHQVGDALLTEVVKRINACLRANDFLARIGGDEFAVILGEIKDKNIATQMANSIITHLSKVVEIEGNKILVGASIGVAFYPEDGATVESLMRNADVAMYHAKSLGKNNFQFYAEDLYERYRQQLRIEHALKFALDKNEFSLKYQPIHDLKSKEVVGLEAILNWRHPTFGSISPRIFFPVAEKSGIMSALSYWMIENACNEAVKWKFISTKNFKLAINISAKQLLQKKFISTLNHIVDTTKVNPHWLEFELTEATATDYPSWFFTDIINQIHAQGISIAIDDFAMAYTFMTKLKNLPIRTIKIDSLFVQDILENANSETLVKCLIELGKNLNLKVIAEGIENEDQYYHLLKLGCQHGQGHYLSNSLDPEQIPDFFKKKAKMPV